MMKNLMIIFCFISLAATCQDQSSQSQDKQKNPCDPDIMCTMEFRIINLQIVNENGEAVILDEFYTKIGGKKIEIPEDVYELEAGFYPVATDGQMEILDFDGSELSFIGKIDGETIVNHQMRIGRDCCHIQLVEGDQKIVIEG